LHEREKYMKYVQVLVDNSTAVLNWLTALFGMLLLLGIINLNQDQIAGIMVFAGATIGLIALLLTVAKRTVVTRVDSSGIIRAGAGSAAPTGSATPVQVNDDGTLTPQVPVDPSLAKAA
jgi:hypothetical protein